MNKDPQLVSLDDIVIEPAMQARSKHLSATHVNRLRGVLKACRDDPTPLPFPPISIARLCSSAEGAGKLYLIDGFHRCEAFRLEGVERVSAVVVDVRNLAEARWLAASGNMQHGLPLSSAEVREAFRRFIKAEKHLEADLEASPKVIEQRPKRNVMTLSEIGKACGRPQPTVRRWLQKDYPHIFRKLYERSREKGEDWGGERPAQNLFLEPSTLELVSMSLENVERMVRGGSGTAEHSILMGRVAETLASLSLPDYAATESVLSVDLFDPFGGKRSVKISVSVEGR